MKLLGREMKEWINVRIRRPETSFLTERILEFLVQRCFEEFIKANGLKSTGFGGARELDGDTLCIANAFVWFQICQHVSCMFLKRCPTKLIKYTTNL